MISREKEKNLLKIYGMVGALLGAAFLIFGILLMIYTPQTLGVSFPNNGSAPWGFLLVGLLIILTTVTPWLESRVRTKKQEFLFFQLWFNLLLYVI